MADENRAEKRSTVIKKYGSHLAYAAESSALSKLRGRGLAPELVTFYDGVVEYESFEGTPLDALIAENISDQAALAELFEAFCRWYSAYREEVRLSLGDFSLSSFVMTEKGLIGTDYEHCRPGGVEGDLARFVLCLCGEKEPFSQNGIRAAKLFICVCASFLQWRSELLEKNMLRYFRDIGIDADCGSNAVSSEAAKTVRELICSLCCCGVVVCGDAFRAIASGTSFLASFPQRVICSPFRLDPACRGFENFRGNSVISAMSAAARNCTQQWMLFLGADEDCRVSAAAEMLGSCKGEVDAFVSAEGTFPLLIRTSCAVEYISTAGSVGELKSMIADSLKVKVFPENC